MCWSIKEVNKNLSDRLFTADFSIEFLKKACLKLSDFIKDLGEEMPDEVLEVVNDKGQKIEFSLSDIANMLLDSKKILEYRLIDLIDSWARQQYVKSASNSPSPKRPQNS